MSQAAGDLDAETASARPAQGRFVWPPIRVPDGVEPNKAPQGADPEPQEPLLFSPRAPEGITRPRGPLSSWWRQVEETWLAPVSPPLDVRIEQAAWHPDPFDAYCERCGSTVGLGETTSGAPEFGCSSCRDTPLPWDRFVRLSEYHAHLADWVQETKFSRCHWLGESLGIELGRTLRESGALGNPASTKGVCVVPVATSFWRRITRGIDHARCIARGVARELDVPLISALSRDHRPTQRGLSPTARLANVAGTFTMRRGVDVAGRTVILVDDVRTTGATLREAAKALGGSGRRAKSGTNTKNKAGRPARIIIAALAVTPDPQRKMVLESGATNISVAGPEPQMAGNA